MMNFTNKSVGRQVAPSGEGQAGASGLEDFVLSGYADGELRFKGRLFSEGSFFDDETGALTRLRLFALEDRRLVYSVVSVTGARRERRVYVLRPEEEFCHIDDGRQSVTLPLDMLFSAVFGLCGLDQGQEEQLKVALEESLRAVGA